MRFNCLLLLFILVYFSPSENAAWADSRPGIANQLAPEIVLDYWIDANGRQIDYKFANTKGKYVYLYFFQSWCPGCHSHGFPTIKTVANAFRHDDRVVFLAIQTVFEGYSINTLNKVREIQKQYQLPVIMGHDPGDPASDTSAKSMRDYRSGGTPWVIIIDPTGTVIFNDFGIDSDAIIKYLREALT
jgi:thiol-disulfide isomerase/thioredoxin